MVVEAAAVETLQEVTTPLAMKMRKTKMRIGTLKRNLPLKEVLIPTSRRAKIGRNWRERLLKVSWRVFRLSTDYNK